MTLGPVCADEQTFKDGIVMRTIIVNVPRPASLSVEMEKMRQWLDAQGCVVSNFRCDVGQKKLTFWVGFSSDREADMFKRQFVGSERELVNFGAASVGLKRGAGQGGEGR